MTDFLFEAHRWWQYIALLAVVASLVFAFRSSMMDRTAETVYRVTAIVVDIQVALGVLLWFAESGWELGVMQGWVHPIVGLAALAVLHVFIGRARKGHPEVANRTVRTGLIIAIVLVVTAIGIAEMA